ncbi:MAG: hypothetical protein ACXAC2_13755 [Candidatus Kariarchaeaceae archaeon]|jgi:hypothetical protein
MITEKLISDAYEHLSKCRENMFQSADILAQDKTNLKILEAKGLADGSIEGKNQQMRDASAREVLAEQFDLVDTSQFIYDKARLDFDLANYEVNKFSLIVRYLEIK